VRLCYWHHQFDDIQFPGPFLGRNRMVSDRLAARSLPAPARWKACRQSGGGHLGCQLMVSASGVAASNCTPARVVRVIALAGFSQGD